MARCIFSHRFIIIIYLTSGHDDNTNSDKWCCVLSIMGTSLLLFIYFNQQFIGKFYAGKTTILVGIYGAGWPVGGVATIDDYESTEFPFFFFGNVFVCALWLLLLLFISTKWWCAVEWNHQKSGNSWWQIFQWTHTQKLNFDWTIFYSLGMMLYDYYYLLLFFSLCHRHSVSLLEI